MEVSAYRHAQSGWTLKALRVASRLTARAKYPISSSSSHHPSRCTETFTCVAAPRADRSICRNNLSPHCTSAPFRAAERTGALASAQPSVGAAISSTHAKHCTHERWRGSTIDRRRHTRPRIIQRHPRQASQTKRIATPTANLDASEIEKRRRCPLEAVCRHLHLARALREGRRRESGQTTGMTRVTPWRSASRDTLIRTKIPR